MPHLSIGVTPPAPERHIQQEDEVYSVWLRCGGVKRRMLRIYYEKQMNVYIMYTYIHTYYPSFVYVHVYHVYVYGQVNRHWYASSEKHLQMGDPGRSFGTKIPYSKVFGGSWTWATPICQSNLSFWPDCVKDARVKDLRLCQLGLMLPGWRATRHKIYSDHNLSSASPCQRWSVVNTCKGMSKPIIFLHQLVCCKLPRYVPPSIYIPMTFNLFCV